MYISGHLLASSVLAIPMAKKLNTSYIFCAALMMFTNVVDADHIFQYQLDNGAVNSLSLHYAHLYAGLPIFLLLFSGILFKNFKTAALIATTGISFHLVCDMFANAINYNFIILGFVDIIMIVLLFLFLKNVISNKEQKLKILAFFTFIIFFGNFSQYYISIIKEIKPNESMIPYGYAAICNLLLPVAFYLLCRKPNQPINA